MEAKDQKFLEFLIQSIVDHPDEVKVERKVDEMGVLIELTVNPADMGKIIGKEGKTAKSLRTLLRVLGAKENARVNLKIIEPEGGKEMKSVEKDDKSDNKDKEEQSTDII